MKMLKILLVVLVASNMSFAFAATTVNAWKPSVTSGKWSQPENWSLGHVPTSEEEVQFQEDCPSCTVEIDGAFTIARFNALAADGCVLTFTGTGSLNVDGDNEYIRRETIINGPSLNFKNTLMTYSRVEVRSGTLACATYWRYNGACGLEVTGGAVVCTNCFRHRTYVAGAQSIVVAAGSFTTPRIVADAENVHGRYSFSVSVSGGVMEVGELNLSAPGALTQTGGELRLSNGSIDLSKVSVSLSGGTLKFVGLMAYGSGTLYETVRELLGYEPDATEGYLCAPEGRFLVVPSSMTVRGIGSMSSLDQYVDSRSLTLTGTPPFSFAADASRVFNIYGPTTFRTTADMTYEEGDQNNVTVNVHGSLIIDTRDEADPSVTHTMYLSGIASPDGSAELTVSGGGTFLLRQRDCWNPIKSVSVEPGSTLALAYDAADSSWSELSVESLTLGAGATLKMNANGSFVRLASCEIDPAARILVAIPAAFEGSDAWPILQTTGSATLPAALVDQVELVGAPEGTAVKCEFGQLMVYLRGNDLGKWSDTGVYEWTGAGSGNDWTTGANWHGGNAPIEKTDVIYGSSASSVSTYNGLGVTGSTINKIVFKNNAIESFSVGGTTKQLTLYQAATAVLSYANALQTVDIQLRSTATSMGVSAYGAAPLVTGSRGFVFSRANATLSLAGAVWLSGGSMTVPQVNFRPPTYPQLISGVTILDGATLTVSSQTSDIAETNTGFRVNDGGTLIISGGGDARYCRSAKSQLQLVNGTLEIRAPFVGGADQSFGGSGRLDILAGTRSGAANSRVLFANELNVHIASWDTVTADADTAVAISIAGSPTLHVSGAWSYGTASGVVTETTVTDRALVIQGGATLTMDANGGSVSFADPFVGDFATVRRPSTIAITNGTLNLDGTFETDVGVKARFGGNVHVLADQTIGGFSAEAGSTVTFAATAALDVDGDVSLSGFSPVFEETDEAKRWRTVVRVAPGGLVSLPPEGGELEFRAVETDGKISVQCRRRIGMVVSLR